MCEISVANYQENFETNCLKPGRLIIQIDLIPFYSSAMARFNSNQELETLCSWSISVCLHHEDM